MRYFNAKGAYNGTGIIKQTNQPVKLMGRDTAVRIVYGHGPYARDMLNKLQEDAVR